MQLGTRWNAGAEPPPRIPDPLRAAIAEVEARLEDTSTARWTLTWLEGRPVVELDAPDSDLDGTTLR